MKNEDKSMSIIDIACPYDLYIENTYQDEIGKYLSLRAYLTSNGFGCEIKAIVIGFLGTVHHKAITTLCEPRFIKETRQRIIKVVFNLCNHWCKDHLEHQMQTCKRLVSLQP